MLDSLHDQDASLNCLPRCLLPLVHHFATEAIYADVLSVGEDIWCVNQISPHYVCTLFWEAVSRTKKTAPPPEAQRSVIPLDDVDEWSVKTRRFV